MLTFELADALCLLGRTPAVLREWIADLPAEWTALDEGPGSWSAGQIVGHLVHGERTDWMVRVEHILSGDASLPFEPFDREGMTEDTHGKSTEELIHTFKELRESNLIRLRGLNLDDDDLERRGLHPELGPVTLRQLLATWVAHDLAHLGQIARVMAKQYRDEVGPWRQLLPLLDR